MEWFVHRFCVEVVLRDLKHRPSLQVRGSSTKALELHQLFSEVCARYNSIMETVFSAISVGRLSANNWMPSKSSTTALSFGHLATPTFCIQEKSHMLVDEKISECSDSKNGDDNTRGNDSVMAPPSFTQPPSPRVATSSHVPREDYLGSYVLESGETEKLQTTSIDMGILPPTNTPAVANSGSPTLERKDNVHQISDTTLQALHAKLKSRPSRSTSIVDASEASSTQGHEIESHQINHRSLSIPSESHHRQEDSQPSTAADNDEEPPNPSHAEREAATQEFIDLQTQRSSTASRMTSVTSSHSVYIVPRVPRLYYKHDSPSCWSILTNLLTTPIRRLRTRKRSVRDCAAMEQELRELHARMRETEMRMKQDGTQVSQAPQYVDVQKDGATAKMHETMEGRPNGDAR